MSTRIFFNIFIVMYKISICDCLGFLLIFLTKHNQNVYGQAPCPPLVCLYIILFLYACDYGAHSKRGIVVVVNRAVVAMHAPQAVTAARSEPVICIIMKYASPLS